MRNFLNSLKSKTQTSHNTMIQTLIVTHGSMAQEMLTICEFILKAKLQAKAVCLPLDEPGTDYTEKIRSSIEELPVDNQLIILTDMFGGTPSNTSIPWVKTDKIEVITGLNLPMLLYLASHFEKLEFRELCEGIRNSGRDAISIAGDFLS